MKRFYNWIRLVERRNLMLAGAFAGLLAGCQGEPPAPGAVNDSGTAREVGKAGDDRKAHPVEPEERTAQEQPTVNPEPLDLSMPADLATADEYLAAEDERLPDLFQRKSESNTRISGRVYMDEEGRTLRDAMQGGEITIERKLN